MLTHPIKAVFLDDSTLDVHEDVYQPLIALFDTWQAYPLTAPDELVKHMQGAQVVISNKTEINKETMLACPDLKLILVTATGTNNIDVAAAKELGITVCNSQGYGTDAVTQHTMMLILALAGNLLNYNESVKNGEWQQTSSFCLMHHPMVELANKTLGIIGYGALGQGVAKLAKAFGMKVIIGQIPNRPLQDNALALEEFLPQIDVLSLHCPLTEETRHLISERELRLMKPNALLVNTARGGIINEEDLAKVLKSGHLGGAATDVLTVEPPTNGNVLLDPTIPRLVITPHCAWATYEARVKLVAQAVANVKAFMAGKPTMVVG